MPGGDEPRTYLVECFWPEVDEPQHAAAAERARAAALERQEEGDDVEFLGSILVPADETVFCLFAGREQDVRAASERAGLPFERVLEARIDEAGQISRKFGSGSSYAELTERQK
jgi:Nickel responsive protein SCO4226-like